MDLSETRLMVAAPLFASILDRGRTSPYETPQELQLRKEGAASLALLEADILIDAEREIR